jgi:ribosomal biogenesis protein LAS1
MATNQPTSPTKRPTASFLKDGHYKRRNQRMNRQIKLTPWLDGWEFDAVGKALVSAAAATTVVTATTTGAPEQLTLSLQEALERVAVWKTRISVIPHAIESTAAIAQLFAREATTTATTTVTELRLAFSCAILRSINGLADVMQQQRSVAASVASLCGHLGIPAWLVDIRHEATHNQLPSLPVLRMAATTLLDYYRQVYWDPMFLSRQADLERASNMLQAYKTASTTSTSNAAGRASVAQYSSSTKTKQTTTAAASNDKKKDQQDQDDNGAIVDANANADANADADDSSSSDDEIDATDWVACASSDIWGSSIGTTSNRFAALLDKCKSSPAVTKKDAKRPAAATTSGPMSSSKRKRALRLEPEIPTPTSCAHAYVKAKFMAVDVWYHSALLFLVWGGGGSGSPAGRGALIPGSLASFPESSKGVEKVRQRYLPLILALGKEWPGFLSALLVHVVDFIVSIESAAELQGMDAGSTRKLYFLTSWARYLVSFGLLAHIDRSIKMGSDRGKDASRPAPLALLKKLGYPLNSLCDRCSRSEQEASGPLYRRSTSRQLAKFFAGILGDDRVQSFGVDLTATDAPGESESSDDPQPKSVALVPQNNASAESGLTLAEMEAMFSSADGPAAEKLPAVDMKPPKMLAPRTAWLRCTSWEPSALGTLPGYPM